MVIVCLHVQCDRDLFAAPTASCYRVLSELRRVRLTLICVRGHCARADVVVSAHPQPAKPSCSGPSPTRESFSATILFRGQSGADVERPPAQCRCVSRHDDHRLVARPPPHAPHRSDHARRPLRPHSRHVDAPCSKHQLSVADLCPGPATLWRPALSAQVRRQRRRAGLRCAGRPTRASKWLGGDQRTGQNWSDGMVPRRGRPSGAGTSSSGEMSCNRRRALNTVLRLLERFLARCVGHVA